MSSEETKKFVPGAHNRLLKMDREEGAALKRAARAARARIPKEIPKPDPKPRADK